MFKRVTLKLAAIVLLMVPVLSSPVYAAKQDANIDHGLILNNRVFIPLRAVSEQLNIPVKWYQNEKTISLQKGDTKILLATNVNRGIVLTPSVSEDLEYDLKYIETDSPAQIINGTTYVPLRFISQSLGANVTWNQQSKEAHLTMDGMQIVVNIRQAIYEPVQKITNTRLQQLSQKLNEAADLSLIQNINSHFKASFTDYFIDSIMKNNELRSTDLNQEPPVTTVNYTSKNSAIWIQSTVLGPTLTGDQDYVEDRICNLVYINGVWKVNSVDFKLRLIPYLVQ